MVSNHATFHKRAVIVGAGLLGRNLAILLEKAGFTVKVIEKDIERCEALAAKWIKPLSSMGMVRILIY